MEREHLSPTRFARFCRKHATSAEGMLWDELKHSKTGFKFSRQIHIGEFFVDFCCRQHRLVIELDGEAHLGHEEEDARREEAIRGMGYEVLRFSNDEVRSSVKKVVAQILATLEARPRFRY